MKTRSILSWTLRIIAAFILLQTLFFKFTAAEESVYIFSQLGMEPWGRIGSGIAELVVSILLLIPSTVIFGAFGAIGLMIGAIASHLTVLGIEVQGDGGQLFFMGIMVLVAALSLLYLHRTDLSTFIQKLQALVFGKPNKSLL